jgi:hypothetical protein
LSQNKKKHGKDRAQEVSLVVIGIPSTSAV